jgi:NADPH2:quinone reductase
MRAIRCNQYGPPESLVVENLPDLEAPPGHVVIDVKAAAVNFPDVLIIENKYQFKPPLPFTPGSEVAGIVRAVGADVTRFKPGSRVVAFTGSGGFAEQALAPAAACVPLADGVDFDVAAAFTLAYGTSHHAVVDRGQLQAGETMLVLGAAGGVGLAAVEIGKALGARVIAAASSDEKLATCVRHGADATINYSTEDLRERIKALTDGKGPDVIYDPVGGIYAEPAFRSIGWRGRYLVVGFANGEIEAAAQSDAAERRESGRRILGRLREARAETQSSRVSADDGLDWRRQAQALCVRAVSARRDGTCVA